MRLIIIYDTASFYFPGMFDNIFIGLPRLASRGVHQPRFKKILSRRIQRYGAPYDDLKKLFHFKTK